MNNDNKFDNLDIFLVKENKNKYSINSIDYNNKIL